VRPTIKGLTECLNKLTQELEFERRQRAVAEGKLNIYERLSGHLITMTVATERVVDAVAHVLTDLKRRQ
jgi:hypothetical protein